LFFVMHKRGINMHVLPSFIQIFYTRLLMQNSLFGLFLANYCKLLKESLRKPHRFSKFLLSLQTQFLDYNQLNIK